MSVRELLLKAKEVLSWCIENADEKWMVDHTRLVDSHIDQALAELENCPELEKHRWKCGKKVREPKEVKMPKKTAEDFEVPDGFTLISNANFIAEIGKCEKCKLQAENKRLKEQQQTSHKCEGCDEIIYYQSYCARCKRQWAS